MFGFVEDAWEATGGAVIDVAEEAWDAGTEWVDNTIDDVGSFVEDTASDAFDWFGEAATDFGETVLDTAADGLDWFAGGLEDVGAFDLLDTGTFGLVDLSYEDGQFNADIGIDDVASFGFSVGEQGVSAEVDTLVFDANVGYDGSNIAAGIAAGIDAPMLPYVAADVKAGDDGFQISGEAQATLPTPWGLVSGEVAGDYYQNPDGSWGAHGQVGGGIITTGGVTAGGTLGAGYDETADGDSVFTANASGYVGVVGGPQVEAGVGYTHAEIDGQTIDSIEGNVGVSGYGLEAGVEGGYTRMEDAEGNVVEQYEGGVEASGYGVEVEADGSYTRAESVDGTVVEQYEGSVGASGYGASVEAGGSQTTVTGADGTSSTTSDTWADVDGFDTDALLSAAGNLLDGPAGQAAAAGAGAIGSIPDVADTVSNLAGSGDLADVLNTMADAGGGSVADVAGGLAESANFDDFSSDIIESEVTEAVADEVWDDLGS